jgi:4-hydroxybenzoyl-CoA thioesterase/acyl-CoA thioester hydrolase
MAAGVLRYTMHAWRSPEGEMREFSTRRKIEFADTDMGGIVHFSRYVVFMETAEHEFLNAIGASVDMELEGRRIGWPRVAVSCEYKSPARFGDILNIRVQVARKGAKSMTYRFRFDLDGREVATGEMTSVCCVLEQGRPLQAIEIPSLIADKIDDGS